MHARHEVKTTGEGRWRRMTLADLAIVEHIARRVHPSYPEDISVIAERLALYPHGCLVFGGPHGVLGYTIAYPWMQAHPPRLNTRLQRLPVAPDTFFIHDLALLPELRRAGAGSAAVHLFVEQAGSKMLKTVSLVAVAGSTKFWRRHGFREVGHEVAGPALLSYGDAARLMVRSLL